MAARRKRMIGRTFGHLKVIERVHNPSHKATFICTCVCGGLTLVRGSHLRTGAISSCGCKKASACRAAAERRWERVKAAAKVQTQ